MKRHRTAIWADRVFFEVRGENARRCLGLAARAGVSFSCLSCTENGYSGNVAGGDVARLHKAAEEARAELQIQKRRGPGKGLERLAARSGLLAGVVVFFLLQWYLGGFVWTIDFGEMEPARQAEFRAALSGQGIWEGCRLEEEKLRAAEDALELEMQEAGWISLNFTGGCLFVEENEREVQEIRQETQPQALYAKAGGQILAIELESGFAQAVAGQYVAPGQLLANGQKADRSGQAVVQGASGRILGKIQKTYTVQQPLQDRVRILTGKSSTANTWYLLGHTWQTETQDPIPGAQTVTEWLPLHLGRLSLPGCVCRVTQWETDEQMVSYTEEQAGALAARRCRQLLLQGFEDAELEKENLIFETADGVVTCRAEYVFRAELAQSGPLAPIETVQGTS